MDTSDPIQELDTVALLIDRASDGLRQGEVGTVVYVYGKSEAYEVEFVEPTGYTKALITARPNELRLVERWKSVP